MSRSVIVRHRSAIGGIRDSRIVGIRRADLDPKTPTTFKNCSAAAHEFARRKNFAIEETNGGVWRLLPQLVRFFRRFFQHR